MVPNLMCTNTAKYTFASNYHEMCKIVQDIAGGLAPTVPIFRER